MGLLKKFLGGGSGETKEGAAAPTQFHESEATAQRASTENAPRRELVHVVLRDTMRRLAIPSDWIDCRILSVVTRKHKTGMHVQFIVRHGEEQLLPYVRAFQDTFWAELERFESRPRDWLFSLAWQFEGARRVSPPLPAGWEDDTRGGGDERGVHDTQPPEEDPDELATDLQALYAIRDAELSRPASLAPLPPQEPPRE